jgi:hypothetical protein
MHNLPRLNYCRKNQQLQLPLLPHLHPEEVIVEGAAEMAGAQLLALPLWK